jgi:hypothetical protein
LRDQSSRLLGTVFRFRRSNTGAGNLIGFETSRRSIEEIGDALTTPTSIAGPAVGG